MKFLTNLLIWALFGFIVFVAIGASGDADLMEYQLPLSIVSFMGVAALLILPSSVTVQALQIKITQNFFFKLIDKGLKSYGPGFHWKQLWEKVEFVIDMRREVVITNREGDMDKELNLTSEHQVSQVPIHYIATKDGMLVGAVWMTRFNPNENFILNYIQQRESAIVESIVAIVSQYFSDEIAKRNYEDIISEKKKLSEGANNIFNGKAISDFEKENGIILSEPQLYDFKLHPESEAALLGQQKNKAVDRSVKNMYEQFIAVPGNDPTKFDWVGARKRAETAAGYRTEQGVDIDLDVEGLQNLRHLNIVGNPFGGGGGGGSKPSGKGGKP